ncbi:hypothetical protein LCGC14_3035070 [marine sediment metagenome]|uniref:Uncharacterized protein n=1 Tax=marine sediment metagenome TaxID=412755 RepID=A0A0F8XEL8_9ZZZZ
MTEERAPRPWRLSDDEIEGLCNESKSEPHLAELSAHFAQRKLMEYMVIKMKQKWREITGLEFKYDPENTLIDFPGICEAMGMNFEGIEVPA